VAKPHERVFALIGAVLFLCTSVAVSVAVVWQVHQQNQDAKQAAQPKPDCTSASVADYTIKQGDKLQGTALQNFTPCKTTELQKIDIVVGTGVEAKATDTVTAHYTGAVTATGIIFQSSHDTGQPAQFPLDQVIKGWTEGVPGMKIGGKRRLIIPAALAYGSTPPAGSGIPADADLVFDIELVSIP
jgi:FKBP-type peptidyl-prolyl cis-trans isomerase